MSADYSFGSILFFVAIVVMAFALDLFFHKKSSVISVVNATLWSFFWVALSFGFAFFIYQAHGQEHAMLFLTGYFLEKSLSVDNLFAFMAVFSSFSIKDHLQHRILHYGILGAILLRFIFIMLGSTILLTFGKIAMAIFGFLVLWSAWKMWQQSRLGENVIEDYSDHWSVRLTKRIIPIHPKLEEGKFFVLKSGGWYATPLLLCLVAMEVVDVLFAFDSVPAVFSVFAGTATSLSLSSQNFLILTSNLFAIFGLRSLYFLLTAAKRYLIHLEKAVIVILVFVGVKMIAGMGDFFHISPELNLIIVLSLLFIGMFASFIFPKKNKSL